MQEPTIITEQTRAASSEESNECERMIEELPTEREVTKESRKEEGRGRGGGVCMYVLARLFLFTVHLY